MRRVFLGLIVSIFVFGLAGWLGFTLYGEQSISNKEVATRSVSQAKVITPKSVEVEREIVTGQSATTSAPPPAEDTPPEPKLLSYYGWEARDLGDQAQACFSFSERLPKNQDVELKSYVEISPKTPFSLAVRNSDICVLGLDFAKEYTISLLPGLTALDGAELQARRDVVVTFGDKPAFIDFVGEGIILPKTKQGKLGINTMNVEAVDMTL